MCSQLACKDETRVELLAKVKHANLLCLLEQDQRGQLSITPENIYNTCPWESQGKAEEGILTKVEGYVQFTS
jgi:hypothetical protein